MKILVLILILLAPLTVKADYYQYNWTYDKDLTDLYIGERKDFLLKNIEPIYTRGLKYRSFIQHVSKKYDVPKEIFAIASIESGFGKIAESHAGAVGMWQLMKPTAKEMGLVVNNKIDERKNWKKSTIAAVKYIKHLADDYFDGDYELAILAYNAGVGNVKKSIKRMNSNNAWYLIKNDKLLKRESKEYLVKFIIYAYYFEYLDTQLKLAINKNNN